MKNLLLVLLGVIYSFITLAQTPALPKPEFPFQPYLWDKNTHKLIKPSKETLTTSAPNLTPRYHDKSVAGATSGVIVTDSSITIVVECSAQGPVPYSISKLELLNGNRFMAGSRSLMKNPYHTQENNLYIEEHTISTTPKKLYDHVYELVPDKPLAPGEYGIELGATIYCFTVK